MSDVVGGILSDRIGRKRALIISAICVAFSSAMVALFGRSYYVYPIGRFALIVHENEKWESFSVLDFMH